MNKTFILKSMLVIFTVCFLLIIPAQASRITPISLDDLADQATYILIGTVMNITSDWSESGDFIYSNVEIDIDSLIFGDYTNSSITIRLWGGNYSNTEISFEDGPTFEINEQVLLYLDYDYSNLFPIIGFNQGKYTVSKDEITGEAVLLRESQSVSLESHLANLRSLLEDRQGAQDEK